MRLRWTVRATEDLKEIGRYISQDDPGAARRWVARLRTRSSDSNGEIFGVKLKSPEFMGRKRGHRRSPERRKGDEAVMSPHNPELKKWLPEKVGVSLFLSVVFSRVGSRGLKSPVDPQYESRISGGTRHWRSSIFPMNRL